MSNNELSKKIVDCYNDILKREPDKEGFNHFLEKIISKEITFNDLKIILENSEEFKTLKDMENSCELEALWDVKLSGKMGMFTGIIKKHIKSGTEQALQAIKEEVEN